MKVRRCQTVKEERDRGGLGCKVEGVLVEREGTGGWIIGRR
jgi:hypothetical protein